MRAAAGVLLIAESTGRVLLCLRRADGTWATPGGHLEPGERPLQGALRELGEETGYRGPVQLERGLRLGSYHLFIGRIPREFRPVLDHEHYRAVWARPQAPPEPLHPGLAPLLPP